VRPSAVPRPLDHERLKSVRLTDCPGSSHQRLSVATHSKRPGDGELPVRGEVTPNCWATPRLRSGRRRFGLVQANKARLRTLSRREVQASRRSQAGSEGGAIDAAFSALTNGRILSEEQNGDSTAAHQLKSV
jgi:hypothetical protein